ncbi:MAG: ATP-binding protein [Bacillota bacterium]|jgi:two-component system phosphate regulon sensor histidine kinase PhoR
MRRRLLSAFLLVACLVMAILGGFLVVFSRNQHIRNAENYAENQAKVLRVYLAGYYCTLSGTAETNLNYYENPKDNSNSTASNPDSADSPVNTDNPANTNSSANLQINAELARLSQESGLRITLIGKHGVVLADTGSDPAKMDSHDTRPEVAQAMSQGKGISIRYSQTLGTDMLYFALPVHDEQSTFLGVLRVAMPVKLMETELSRNWLTFGMVITAALAVAFVTATLQSKHLAKPVELMSQMSKEMAQGDFTERSFPNTGTEVDSLGTSLNSLAASLDMYIAELTRANEKMKTILDSAVAGMILVHANGIVSSVNASAERILGCKPEETQGMQFHSVIRNSEVNRLFETSLLDKKPQRKEIKILFPSERILDVTAVPLLFSVDSEESDPKKAGPDGVLLVFYDLTQVRRLETTRSDFIQNISHELRTPTTVIKGFAETLRDVPPDDKESVKEMAGLITDEVSRLYSLVESLLSLAKIESGRVIVKKAWLDAHTALGQIIRKMEPLALQNQQTILLDRPEQHGEPQKIQQQYKPQEPGQIHQPQQPEQRDKPLHQETPIRFFADLSLFQTIFANLLDNAVKYSGLGGHITVSIRQIGNMETNTAANPKATCRRANSKGQGTTQETPLGPGVLFTVSDDGPGISEEDLPRIFERFYRSSKDRSRSTGGSGLGLSIVKHCVGLQGGKVWAENGPGQGTTFYVWFPDP